MGWRRWFIQKMEKHLLQEVTPSLHHLSDYDRLAQAILPGDVLLVEGRLRVSRIIKNIANSPWTHAALYIGRLHTIENQTTQAKVKAAFDGPPETQLLLESQLGEGTIITPLKRYACEHLRICRPRNLSMQQAQQLIQYAVGQLGRPYNKRHFFDLGRYMLANPLIPRSWYSSLFHDKHSDTNQVICSTMIAEAFASIHFPILPAPNTAGEAVDPLQAEAWQEKDPRLITPRDFDYSPYFEIIKYPMTPYVTRDCPEDTAFRGKAHDEDS